MVLEIERIKEKLEVLLSKSFFSLRFSLCCFCFPTHFTQHIFEIRSFSEHKTDSIRRQPNEEKRKVHKLMFGRKLTSVENNFGLISEQKTVSVSQKQNFFHSPPFILIIDFFSAIIFRGKINKIKSTSVVLNKVFNLFGFIQKYHVVTRKSRRPSYCVIKLFRHKWLRKKS